MSKNKVNEASSASGVGPYKTLVVMAPQIWNEKQLGPFTEPVSEYTNAELAYDSMDGTMDVSKEKAGEIERKTKIASKKAMKFKHDYIEGQNDPEGGVINPISESDRIKMKLIAEDLAVWFGTKKKPKGSKQPKGPWVNICRKEDGKHPPCGRSKAQTKGYPKCRAVHVASKMSDAEKRSACQQKRAAEKKDPKIGKGNKPTMVSYKPRKESVNKKSLGLIKEGYDSSQLYPVDVIYNNIINAPREIKKIVSKLEPVPCKNERGEKKMCFRIPEVLYVYFMGNY